MAENIPNLNVDELAAYATTKSQAGVSDDEILREITQMLRDDGWKEAAIGPTIEAVVKRTTVVGGRGSPRQGSPPKANQDVLTQMMTQMQQVLSRLDTFEQMQARRHLEPPTGVNTPSPSTTASEPPPAEPTARGNKFPHPDPFDGDRQKYLAFRYKTQAKLRHDYGGSLDIARIEYVVSRCAGRAADVLLPWAIQNQEHQSIKDLWKFMDQQFDDPHQTSKALDKLSSLRQGKLSVRDYHMEFNRLEIQSGEQFGEAARKSMFLKGLHVKLQESLATVDGDLTFEQLVNKAVRTSDNLYRAALVRSRAAIPKSAEQPTEKAPQREASPEPMDWVPSRVSQTREPRGETRRPPRTCYTCGEPGHIARYCPNVTRVRKALLLLNSNGQEPRAQAEGHPSNSSEKEEL